MKFHIGDVISIATGYQVSLTDIKGINKLARYMVGSEWNHAFGLSRMLFRNICKKEILRQYPKLEKVVVKGVTKRNIKKWLNKKCKELALPEMLEVKPINWENFKNSI